MGVSCAATAVTVCMLFTFCSSAAASSACPADLTRPSLDTAATAADALVCDINVVRANNGLRQLRWDGRLAAGAQWMANDMAAHGYIAHESFDGRTLAERIEPTGYLPDTPTWLLTENLGWGFAALSSPLAIASGWMDSEGHRENMLDPIVTDIGIGVAPGPDAIGGMIYVADFGTQHDAPPPVATHGDAPPPVATQGYALAPVRTAAQRFRRFRLLRGGWAARALVGGSFRIRALDVTSARVMG
jgi:uncharacterized protein YkwD